MQSSESDPVPAHQCPAVRPPVSRPPVTTTRGYLGT